MIPTPAAKLASDSITSPTSPAYRPLDIDTLYYTRSMFTLRWSVDGEHIYFETNITGRYNIWRVPSTGGWPVQLILLAGVLCVPVLAYTGITSWLRRRAAAPRRDPAAAHTTAS